jgi:hypothetical protein
MWEPLEHLSDDVKEQAARVKDIALALAAGARTSTGATLAPTPHRAQHCRRRHRLPRRPPERGPLIRAAILQMATN